MEKHFLSTPSPLKFISNDFIYSFCRKEDSGAFKLVCLFFGEVLQVFLHWVIMNNCWSFNFRGDDLENNKWRIWSVHSFMLHMLPDNVTLILSIEFSDMAVSIYLIFLTLIIGKWTLIQTFLIRTLKISKKCFDYLIITNE